jgi:hypothetical protein
MDLEYIDISIVDRVRYVVELGLPAKGQKEKTRIIEYIAKVIIFSTNPQIDTVYFLALAYASPCVE